MMITSLALLDHSFLSCTAMRDFSIFLCTPAPPVPVLRLPVREVNRARDVITVLLRLARQLHENIQTNKQKKKRINTRTYTYSPHSLIKNRPYPRHRIFKVLSHGSLIHKREKGHREEHEQADVTLGRGKQQQQQYQ